MRVGSCVYESRGSEVSGFRVLFLTFGVSRRMVLEQLRMSGRLSVFITLSCDVDSDPVGRVLHMKASFAMCEVAFFAERCGMRGSYVELYELG